MARPAVGSLAERLYEQMAPLAYADEQHDWALLKVCSAMTVAAQRIEDLARDTDDGPGWSALVDPDRAPVYALGFVAQLVGVRLRPGLDEPGQRARIKDTAGFRRGTLGAIVGAARQYLTGAKTVVLLERDGGAYRLTVVTRTAETPDADLVEQALVEQKPAGLVLTYVVADGPIINELAGAIDDLDGTVNDLING